MQGFPSDQKNNPFAGFPQGETGRFVILLSNLPRLRNSKLRYGKLLLPRHILVLSCCESFKILIGCQLLFELMKGVFLWFTCAMKTLTWYTGLPDLIYEFPYILSNTDDHHGKTKIRQKTFWEFIYVYMYKRSTSRNIRPIVFKSGPIISSAIPWTRLLAKRIQ